MYLEHFGLQEIPFRITPQTEYFFAGAERGTLLDALVFAITHDEGIVKITGEVGVGKTMLCRMLIERLPADVLTIYITNPSLSPEALLATLAEELGLAVDAGPNILRRIEERLIALYGDGRRIVVIVDEAHAMPPASLEQVRLLSNLESPSRKLLQIVLFGQPELDTLLDTREMRSLRERVTHSFKLRPLSLNSVGAYIRFRLGAAGYRGPDLFGERVIKRIAAASNGLTRRINILADKTLLAAYADDTRNISLKHVKQAIEDAGYRQTAGWRTWATAAALLGAAITLLVVLRTFG